MAVDAADLLDLAASLPDSGEREYRDGATIFTFRGRGIGYVSTDGRYLFVKSTLDERMRWSTAHRRSTRSGTPRAGSAGSGCAWTSSTSMRPASSCSTRFA